MKKFLIYSIVLVVMLFVGYTTYYFIRNNEFIDLSVPKDEAIYINKDETFDMPIVWTRPYKKTTVYNTENVNISNKDVLGYNSETKKFTGVKGGLATVTVTPSNKEFGPFIFDVYVGEGTILNPYYIKTADELQKIGKKSSEDWLLSQSYTLIKDIDLSLYNNGVWEPVGTDETPFSGEFNGNNKIISNLKIVDTVKNAGLFGVVSPSGVVENITLNNVEISGSYDYAGSISAISSGKIGKCNINNLTIKNLNKTGVSGGVVGLVKNSVGQDGKFNNYGNIEMCSVSLQNESNGMFGGIAGKVISTFVYNCKAIINKTIETADSTVFGGLIGEVNSVKDGEESYFSILKNSYVVINNITKTDSTITGAVIGENKDNAINFKNIFKGNMYFVNDNTVQPYGKSNISSLTGFNKKSYAELQIKNTFAGWDFDNTWVLETDNVEVPQLNFFGDYSAVGEYIPGTKINTKEEFLAVLQSIRNNPNIAKVYNVASSIEIDFNGAEFNTIAPNIDKPLLTSILADEGVSITLKNFRLSGANSSVFGYISGINTAISGFNFKDVIVNNSAEYSAIVATINMGATIKNCKIDNSSLVSSSNNIASGMVVGYNQGKIENCFVNLDTLNVQSISTHSNTITLGGISGINEGTIKNVSVDILEFNPISQDASATADIGGIAGRNAGTILNGYNYSGAIKCTFNGQIRCGGVAGMNANDAKISSCFSNGLIELNINNDDVFAGGVAGVNNGGAIIEKSFFATQSIIAHRAAGITVTNNGVIDQCYFLGTITGNKVAGLAVDNFNKITNCAVLGELSGKDSNSVVSGYVSILKKGSIVEHCFSTASFSGQGSFHAESESQFRVTIEETLGFFPDCGDLKNCITINYGQANVKIGTLGFITNGNNFIKCTDKQAKGLEGDYSVFKNDAGFEQTYWTFNAGEEGNYPTLTNVVKNPRETN